MPLGGVFEIVLKRAILERESGRAQKGQHQHFKTSLVLPGGKELSQPRTAITFQTWNHIILTPSVSLWGILPGPSTPGNQNSSEIKSRWIQSLPRGAPMHNTQKFSCVFIWSLIAAQSGLHECIWKPQGEQGVPLCFSVLLCEEAADLKQTMQENMQCVPLAWWNISDECIAVSCSN